jgi:integrase
MNNINGLNAMQEISKNTYDFHSKLKKQLSTYPEKIVNSNGEISVTHIQNAYFLENDIWNIYDLKEIPEFEKAIENHRDKTKSITFKVKNPGVNLEIKYVYFHKLFNDEWKINATFQKQTHLFRISNFINQKYSELLSILDLDIDKVEHEYIDWLQSKGIATQEIRQFKYNRQDGVKKTRSAAFLRSIYTALFDLIDTREEWDKDRWDIRKLAKQYKIEFNQSNSGYYLDFSEIKQGEMRELLKKYIRQRLLSKSKFSWGTALRYVTYLNRFFSFIFSIEPVWKNLSGLTRSHIEQYILWLHEYAKNLENKKGINIERLIRESISILRTLIADIQRYDLDFAPKIAVDLVIFSGDKPKLRKKSIEQIEYIPDYVLEQMFTYINDLHKDVTPILWIAFKTGLRISDILGLKTNCLLQLNRKYSIVADIEKTYVNGHRIPIDDELAGILSVLIQRSKEQSNDDNNPDHLIFVRYHGSRKGKSFSQDWIRNELNALAKQKRYHR